MSLMISPGLRAAAGAALFPVADGAAAGSADRGRPTAIAGALVADASVGLADHGALLNIGAGCEPDCMNSTLTRIATTIATPTRKPTASRGLQPSRRNGLRAPPPAPASAALLPRPERAP